jgi:hypothetical protein
MQQKGTICTDWKANCILRKSANFIFSKRDGLIIFKIVKGAINIVKNDLRSIGAKIRLIP